jgi:hypothetical protein
LWEGSTEVEIGVERLFRRLLIDAMDEMIFGNVGDYDKRLCMLLDEENLVRVEVIFDNVASKLSFG